MTRTTRQREEDRANARFFRAISSRQAAEENELIDYFNSFGTEEQQHETS